MRLSWVYNSEDFRREARRRLPNVIYDYVDQGTLDHLTYDANRDDFRKIWLKTATYPDLTQFTTKSEIFGVPIDFPLFISPMGVHTMFHPDSDVALARSTQRYNGIFMHSGVSGVTIEETAQAMREPERVWAQITDKGDEENVKYFEKIKKLGIQTLIVSAEPKGSSKREKDLHNGLVTMPPRLRPGTFASFATHPMWALRYFTGRKITFADHLIDGKPMKLSEIYGWEEIVYNKTSNWDTLRKIRDQWDGKLVVKGVANPEEAKSLVDIDIDGYILANVGGRHFDGQLSTLAVLQQTAEVVRRSGKDIKLIHDGGITRGGDAVKALALGADYASTGRPWCYALGSFGERGVDRLYEIFKEEYATAQKQIGALRPEDITYERVARNDLPDNLYNID